MTDVDSIRATIRQSVNRITGIAPDQIQDSSNFRKDLDLDSLSALEVMVDVEYAYKIKVSEERMQSVQTVKDAIQVVQEYLNAVQA
jgi:acyl carrier protein